MASRADSVAEGEVGRGVIMVDGEAAIEGGVDAGGAVVVGVRGAAHDERCFLTLTPISRTIPRPLCQGHPRSER